MSGEAEIVHTLLARGTAMHSADKLAGAAKAMYARAAALPGSAVRAAELAQVAVPYLQRLQIVGLIIAAGAVLLSLSRRVPAGWARAAFVAPVVAANLWAPLLFPNGTELMSQIAVAFVVAWLGNLKILGLIINRGPLAMGWWSLPQLLMLYVFPVFPDPDASDPKAAQKPDGAAAPRGVAHTVLLPIAMMCGVAFLTTTVNLPDPVRYYMYAAGLYGFISLLMTLPSFLLTHVGGVETVPAFNRPWAAVTLADFWARRWNLTVGYTLRTLVYDPILERRVIRPGGPAPLAKDRPFASRLRRFLAGAAVFVASGLSHELVMAYILKPYAPGIGMFFYVQAPILEVEKRTIQYLKSRGIAVPDLLQLFVSQFALMVASHLFFFPPLERYTDTAQRVTAAVAANAESLLNTFAR